MPAEVPPARLDLGAEFGLLGAQALQLLLNVVLLIAVGAAGLTTQRAIWRRRWAGPPESATGS